LVSGLKEPGHVFHQIGQRTLTPRVPNQRGIRAALASKRLDDMARHAARRQVLRQAHDVGLGQQGRMHGGADFVDEP